MAAKTYGYFNSNSGLIEIIVQNNEITNVRFVSEQRLHHDNDNEIIANCCQQLAMYFNKELTVFTLPLHFSGTPFQQLVWKETINITYGTTVTYQQIAIAIGYDKAVRAVGHALNQNRLVILVPCHRVVAKKEVGKYRYGRNIKNILIATECKSS